MASKRIRLNLTGIGETLTESAEKKLEAAEDNILEPTCEDGKSLSWYEDMAIKPPKDLVDKLKEFESGVKLEDEDYEEVYSNVSVYEDEILFKVTTEDKTTLFIKGGFTIDVLESCEEIDLYVDFHNLSWFEKKYLLFLNFFRRKEVLTED
jgi:hypothetical protein